MERAEFATGSIDVRGSGAVHRVLSFLGAFFLGIGPGVAQERESENWWDREPLPPMPEEDAPATVARQTELFDATGRATFEAKEPVIVEKPVEVQLAPAATMRRTTVSVKARGKARVVATSRPERAVRVAAVAKTASAARGAVARHLLMSQSISSGREEARWFSVPQRALLPRFQLFEGADSVSEENGGGLRIGARTMRTQRGQVWFV